MHGLQLRTIPEGTAAYCGQTFAKSKFGDVAAAIKSGFTNESEGIVQGQMATETAAILKSIVGNGQNGVGNH